MDKEKGEIIFFNREKRFGFIKPEDGSKDLYVSDANFDYDQPPEKGAKVFFERGEGKKGPEAVSVSLA